MTHLRIGAKESKIYKAAALMLPRVNLCQYLRIRSLRSGSSSKEVWSNSFPLPVKSEFSSEGAATTGQFKSVLRLYDCLMLHEHPLISAESLEHKGGNYSGENRDMI